MPDEHDIPTVEPVGSPRSPRTAPIYVSTPPSAFRAVLRWLGRLVLMVSLFINVVFLLLIWAASNSERRLTQRHYGGNTRAGDKIAVVRVDGLIMEGLMGYPSQQIKDAAQDDSVKAIVLAINSPGGSVTASDQLWKQIKDLREGKWEKQDGKGKRVVAAMESVAASGGYYIAVPADKIFAQPTTITGSIGVYAPFFDLTRVPEKWGIDMRIIKKGDLKGSSLFRALEPDEMRHWDDLLENTYQRFMAIVKEGRGPRLKHGLLDPIPDPTDKKLPNGKPFVRRLADGGAFSSDQAKEFGLVDEIGYLDDAIAEAKRLADLDQANVIMYEKPVTFAEAFFGVKDSTPDRHISLTDLPGISGRLWYLAPGYELSGLKVPATLLK